MAVAMLEWTFGERLAKARKHAGLEQADLAILLGVSRALVSKWERDVTEPSATLAMRWADACDVDPMWILRGNASFSDPTTGLPIELTDAEIERIRADFSMSYAGSEFPRSLSSTSAA